MILDIIAVVLGLIIGLPFLYIVVGLFIGAMDDRYW